MLLPEQDYAGHRVLGARGRGHGGVDLRGRRTGLSQVRCASLGGGREAIGERDDEVAQFIGALDDERPVE